MGSALGSLGGMFGGGGGGGDTADASREASDVQAQAQMEALNYLKQKEATPLRIQEGALKGLAGFYDLPHYRAFAPDLTSQVESDPRYTAMLAAIDQQLSDQQNQSGLEASRGGFLRSGVLADALAKQQARAGVAKGQAFGDIYGQRLQGLQGLAGIQTNAPMIANLMGDIGATQAQGILGAAQSQQAGQQAGFGNLMGLAQTGMAAYRTFYSDIRLKDNIRLIADLSPYPWYEWEWNEKAEKLGLKGHAAGVIAQDVQKSRPDAVFEKDGYLVVDYSKLAEVA